MKNLKIFMVGILLFFIPYALAEPISDDNFECDGFNCGTGWVSSWSYSGTCEIVTLSNPLDVYHMRGVSSCDAIRTFDSTGYNEVLVSFYATATSLENADHCRYYYNDGTTDHLLLDLGNGDDDGSHDFYEFDVTSYGLNSNSSLKIISPTTAGDYCYIDNIVISGTIDIQFNIFTDSSYSLGEIVQVEMSSSLSDTSHTIELYDENNNLFCSDVIISSSSPFTSFFTGCTMPSIQQTNAYAKLYQTGIPGTSTIKYFDVKPSSQNSSMLQIKKVYFSPQVLQGGSTEIFILIEKDNNISIIASDITLIFPDSSMRVLSVSPTVNINEYRAFITDTYQTGNVTFTVNIEGDSYYDTYTNNYLVAGYNVNFVQLVDKVSEVLNVKTVEKILNTKMKVHGTEYEPGENGKVFLQLLDPDYQPITNSTCFASIYYPGNTVWKYNQLMSYVDEGLYVYDFIAPNQKGVYPVAGLCIISGIEISRKDAYDDFSSNSFSGGTGWDGNWVNSGAIIDTISKVGDYSMYCNSDDYVYRAIESNNSYIALDYSFWWRSTSLESGEYWYVEIWDDDFNIYNVLTITNGDDDGIWRYVTGTLTNVGDGFNFDDYVDITISNGGGLGGGDNFWIDAITLSLRQESVSVNNSQYEVIRGTGEVHISSDNLAIVNVIQGNITNETQEGYFYLDLDVISLTSELTIGAEIYFDMYAPFPCYHILNVSVDGVDIIWYGQNPDNSLKGCRVTWEQDLNASTSYNVTIKANKWFTHVENSWLTEAKLDYDILSMICSNYQLANGFPSYPIPINFDPKRHNDTFYAICAQYLDTFYSFNNTYYNEFETRVAVLTEDQMLGLDNMWYYMEENFKGLREISNNILVGLTTGGVYSVAIIADPYPPTNPDYTIYWANLSTNYLAFLRTYAVPGETWAYPSRTLTNYNEDSISEYVWNGTNRTLSSFDFEINASVSVNSTAVAEAVWDSENRTLSSFDFEINASASVNSTAVAEAVWSWEGNIITNVLEQIASTIWEYIGGTAEII